MRTDYLTEMPGVAISRYKSEGYEASSLDTPKADPLVSTETKRGRGRPKGATSSTLTEVRAQAAEEKRKIREELSGKIELLRNQLEALDAKYKEELQDLQEALRITEQRENFFRSALEDRLQIVAEHIHKSLVDWADAELEEGQVTRRKRGRPRKTFK